MAASVSSSREACGSSRRRRGRNARARAEDRPQTFMISMTPDQRHRIPAMERLSSMAAFAPSRAAFATASRRPVKRPNNKDSTTIPVQTQAIATDKHLVIIN